MKWRRYRWGRIAAAVLVVFFLIYTGFRVAEYMHMKEQVAEAARMRDKLLEENRSLQEEKKSLSDPAVIEKKARDELGLVKPGELPYVQ